MLLNFRTKTNQRQKIKVKYETSLKRIKKISDAHENGNIIDGFSRINVETNKTPIDSTTTKTTKHQATVHDFAETDNL